MDNMFLVRLTFFNKKVNEANFLPRKLHHVIN